MPLFDALRELERTYNEKISLSFNLNWPYVKAPIDYWKVCEPGTFQEMWHCSQVPEGRYAHLVPVRSWCAITYNIVPKGAPARFNPTIGLRWRTFGIWLKLRPSLT